MKKKIIVFLILIAFVLIFIIFNKEDNIEAEDNIKKEAETEIKEKVEKIKVDIKGNVLNPGVYEIDNNSRVIDVINVAGGLTEGADTDSINLSKLLSDEDVIIIYEKSIDSKTKEDYEEKIEYCSKDNNDGCIEEVVTFENNETKESSNLKININEATKDDLMNLTGIGEAKAKNIIEYRNNNGKFDTIEDIKNVSGIGDSIYEKIKDNITV